MGIFTLGFVDVGKSIVMVFLTAAITYLYQATLVSGFSFATVDWNAMLTVGGIAAVAYLAKNFFSDANGKFAGVIG